MFQILQLAEGRFRREVAPADGRNILALWIYTVNSQAPNPCTSLAPNALAITRVSLDAQRDKTQSAAPSHTLETARKMGNSFRRLVASREDQHDDVLSWTNGHSASALWPSSL